MKLGVFGGTFNPIHLGHLKIAEHIRRFFGLSQIYFVVAAQPPHKSSEGLAPLIHRFVMVCLATAGHSAFLPSMIELEQPTSPFSLDTLRKLSRKHRLKNTDLYFIAGGDSFLEVPDWHESAKLLTTYNLIFVMRPGFSPPIPPPGFPPRAVSRIRDLTGVARRRLQFSIQGEAHPHQNRIFLLDVDAPDIAASQIRRLAGAGKPYQHLVPGKVHEYIQKLHLYGER